ncbi:MAG: (2Fe-2S)-binding protein [Bacillota bacterium]
MCDCCCEKENNFARCPVCQTMGQLVKSITVKNLVAEDLVPQIKENDYYLCANPKCDIVYFDTNGNVYTQQEVKMPVWFKEGASPKYACYCNKVTVEEVINAVINKGAKDMKTVTEITGAMKHGKCLTNNPSGQCCHKEMQRIIDNALQS